MLGADRLDTLDPTFREQVDLFLARLAAEGIEVAITSARRTIQQQNALYAQGRTAKGDVVTNAKGGSSPHNFGMAVDICPVVAGKLQWGAPEETWKRIADIAVEMGLVSGFYWKSFRDAPHLESKDWRSAQLAWKRGDLIVA